jgi:hypothetical protein
MDAATLTATISSSLFIAGFVGGIARWYVKQHSTEALKEYLQELKPNHGGSLNDAVKLEILPIIKSVKEDIKEIKGDVKELRTHQIEIVKDLSRLEGRVQAHIEEPRLKE